MYFQLECKSSFENEWNDRDTDDQWIKSLRRIEMLYPGSHSFDVNSESGVTNLLLIIELMKFIQALKKKTKNLSYHDSA